MAIETMTKPQTTQEPTCQTDKQVRTYKAAADVIESASEVKIVLDIPGSQADAIDIHVEKGELVVSAKVAERKHVGQRLVREYGVGDFQRSFYISDGLDFNKIEANYQAGVLTITLPKKPALLAKKVVVKST